MSIVHLAQCEWCPNNEPAEEMPIGAESIGAATYRYPGGWAIFDGKAFCGLECLGRWALNRSAALDIVPAA